MPPFWSVRWKKLGRYDILADIKVKTSSDHVWLFYDGERKFDINGSGESILRPLESLLIGNLNACAQNLASMETTGDDEAQKKDIIKEAQKKAEESLSIDPNEPYSLDVAGKLFWLQAKAEKNLVFYNAGVECLEKEFESKGLTSSIRLSLLAELIQIRSERDSLANQYI